MNWTAVAGPLVSCLISAAAATVVPPPVAHAKNGDTHIIGQGLQKVIDCNDALLLVNGTGNTVTAKGNCWAVTVMGSSNTIVADSVSRVAKQFDADKGVKDIQSSIDLLRKTEGCTGKIGAVGYCLGGQLAYLTAARTDVDASVGYYGVNIQNLLGEQNSIKKALMLHIAGKDQFTPPEAQKKIEDGLKNNSHVTMHVYPEMDHAFARVGGEHYDHANAELANGRTATFFRQHLS